MRCSKSMRFGVTEVQAGQPHSNAYRLGLEVGDFLEVLNRSIERGLIDPAGVAAGVESKRRQLAKYLQHDPV